MMNTQADNTDKGKGPRRGAYPCSSFQRALGVAKIVRDVGGSRQPVARSLIAQQLSLSETSSTFAQLLGSVRCFGLIEGRGDSVKLTDLANDYFFPESDGQKREATVKAIMRPAVFEELFKRFDGNKIPAPEMLTNILHRDMKVSESWAHRVASWFIAAVRDEGILDSGGFLRPKAWLHSAQGSARADEQGDVSMATENEPQDLAKDTARPTAPARETTQGVNVWNYSLGESTVRLETSKKLSMAIWQKLEQLIQVLKPEQSASGEADKE